MKADLHVHSNYSYDVPSLPEFSPRALYDRAVARGMGFFVLTDHDTLQGVEELERSLKASFGNHPPIPVVPGVELKVLDPAVGHTIHINVLGLNRTQLAKLERLRNSVERFTRYCRDHHLFFVYNHPLWFERRERARLETVERLIEYFPVIELNAGRIPELNARTAALAWRHGRCLIATSDTHIGQVGKAYTDVEATDAASFLAGVLDGQAEPIPSHFGLREFSRELFEAVDLWARRKPAPASKRALPHGRADRYWLAHRILGRRPLRWSLPRRAVAALLKLLAGGTTYFFIRQQRRTLLRMSEIGS